MTICIDLEKVVIGQSFELIYNQMVLHHVKETDLILEKFYRLLVPGGYLAIADLYAEDGSFHGSKADVYLGFDVALLSLQLQNTGFINVKHELCYTVNKTTATGELKEFPIFLMVAGK